MPLTRQASELFQTSFQHKQKENYNQFQWHVALDFTNEIHIWLKLNGAKEPKLPCWSLWLTAVHLATVSDAKSLIFKNFSGKIGTTELQRWSLNRYEKLKKSNVLLIVRWQQCRTRQYDGGSVAHKAPRCALERCRTPFLRGRIAHFCQRLETQQSIDICVLRTSQAWEVVYVKIAHYFFSLFGLFNCRFSHGRVKIKNLRTTNMRCWLENSTKVLWQTWFSTYCTCNKDTINQ